MLIELCRGQFSRNRSYTRCGRLRARALCPGYGRLTTGRPHGRSLAALQKQSRCRASGDTAEQGAAYSEGRQPQVLSSFAGRYRLACSGVDALVLLHGVQLLAVLVVYPPDMSKL